MARKYAPSSTTQKTFIILRAFRLMRALTLWLSISRRLTLLVQITVGYMKSWMIFKADVQLMLSVLIDQYSSLMNLKRWKGEPRKKHYQGLSHFSYCAIQLLTKRCITKYIDLMPWMHTTRNL